MSLSTQLFRESALERLSSPEQLDQMLQVTSPKGWVSLIAVWTILAAVVTWSIVGLVPTTEEGRGILVSGGGLAPVVAPGAGRIRNISVSATDTVTKDQVVANIDKQDISDQIKDSTRRLKELEAQQDTHDDFDKSEESQQTELAWFEIDRLNRTIEFAEHRVLRLDGKRVKVVTEVAKGSMVDIEIDRVDEDIEATQMTIEQALLQKEQVFAKIRTDSFQRQREALNRRLKVQELAGSIEILNERLEREGQVRSGFAGRVVEVRAAEQTAVAFGETILLVEPTGTTSQDLKAILYVSAQTGGRIEPGMSVQLVPGTVKREEYGSLWGTVVSVAPTTTSKAAMMISLQDRDLVERFSQEIGLPRQVDVELIPDPSTPSGYKWHSAQGPPIKISAGTLCTGSVTVKSQSPISLVIPMLTRLGSGGGGGGWRCRLMP